MGKNVVKESINDVANISLSSINKATQTASTSISSAEIINVKGCKNVVIENVDFDERVIINTEEQLDAYLSNTNQTDIDRQIQQVVKQIAGFLALSSNEASILTNLVTNLVDNMSNSFTQTCNNSASVRQGAICQDTDNLLIKGVKFNSYLNDVNNCIGDDISVNSSTIALKDFISQNSSQVDLGLYGFLYWIGAVVAAVLAALVFIAITAAVAGVAIFADPLFIFGILLFFASVIFLLISFGYFPEWWPYQTTTVLDTTEESKSAKKKNLTLFIVSLSLGLLFLALSVLIFFRGPKTPKKPPTRAQTVQKLEELSLLKRELQVKQAEIRRIPPPPDRQAPGLPSENPPPLPNKSYSVLLDRIKRLEASTPSESAAEDLPSLDQLQSWLSQHSDRVGGSPPREAEDLTGGRIISPRDLPSEPVEAAEAAEIAEAGERIRRKKTPVRPDIAAAEEAAKSEAGEFFPEAEEAMEGVV